MIRSALLGTVALALVGCSNGTQTIDSLRIDGESAIGEDELRKAGASCASAEECAMDLESHYFDRGYLTTTVRPTQGFLQKLTSSYSSLTVEEGALYVVTAVEIVDIGAQPGALGDPAERTALSTIHAGGPFLREQLRDTFAALQERYAAAGYPSVLITPLTDLDQTTHSIKLRIEIDRGSRVVPP